MSLRAGIPLRDMEMVQFHPTGLVAGPGTRITGTIIEEGLRGYGGYLLGGDKERFMHKYDAKVERATRDIVSRGMFSEMRNGNVGPNGGLFITMKHLDPKEVRSRFKGMVDRCRDCGFDLVSGDVEVVPTAHYMMGGVEFQSDCSTELPGLFAAGEDTGGVHGANRLGGNGVANSTVFGGIAGDAIAKWVPKKGVFREPDLDAAKAAISAALYPFQIEGGHMPDIRKKLYEVMWEDAGILRDAESLARARVAVDELHSELMRTGVADESRAYNLSWHDWLNLESQIIISKAVIEAAVVRKDSRGAHFREDFPEIHDLENSRFTKASLDNGKITITSELVEFTRVRPGETLIND